jgi:hypothetical protein
MIVAINSNFIERSLRYPTEYVLVHQDAIHVEHFSRQADDSWIFREYSGLNSTIILSSICCNIRLEEVYSDPFGGT